jgi:hypothetical protein
MQVPGICMQVSKFFLIHQHLLINTQRRGTEFAWPAVWDKSHLVACLSNVSKLLRACGEIVALSVLLLTAHQSLCISDPS